MPKRLRWVFLAYWLPREPSTPRITVWRKLRRLGVAQLSDGVVALPLDARTREQLEWLADEVADAGGEASVWFAEGASSVDDGALADRMAAAAAEEYRAVREEADSARSSPPGQRKRTLARLRRELHAIRGRDYFSPPDAETARAAVEGLAAELEAAR